jgi:predicted DsbA family dithiol-disulfide isomerase
VTENYLTGVAQQAGLNINTRKSDRNNPALLGQVQSDGSAGHAAGVQGTPTLMFQGPKGKALPGSAIPSYSDLQQAINQVSSTTRG